MRHISLTRGCICVKDVVDATPGKDLIPHFSLELCFVWPKSIAGRPVSFMADQFALLFFLLLIFLLVQVSYEEIPLVIRLTYFLLRLIPNRISEVLAINLECLSYPDLGLFSVSIPTSKETPLHIPLYTQYGFFMDGKIESVFYRLLREQQDAGR